MTKIVDTIHEGIIKPIGQPMRIHLVNISFCGPGKRHDELSCLGIDGSNKVLIHVRSHRFWEEYPARFVFELALATENGSCFRQMMVKALSEGRGFILDGQRVESREVDAWFRTKGSADSLPIQESQCRVVSDWNEQS